MRKRLSIDHLKQDDLEIKSHMNQEISHMPQMSINSQDSLLDLKMIEKKLDEKNSVDICNKNCSDLPSSLVKNM